MRTALVERKTKETEISVEINLDGKGESDTATSVPFLDHMLNLFAFHGSLDLKIRGKGDIEIDYHHLIEDMGITLGEALNKALGDKQGIRRYGEATVPMDETLGQVVLDLSGRPYLVYKAPDQGRVKDIDVSLFEDFFRALCTHSRMNLHIIVHYGRDYHHILEAIFKAFGRALREAVSLDPRRQGLPSTKGSL